MEIRHLQYFKILAEELHFGKAAQRLFITQPPLSRQIKELEDELGVLLFERNNKRVVLTQAGTYFLEECHSILQQLERSKYQTKQIHQATTGIFNIGYISTTSKYKLSVVLKKIKEKFPYYHIHLFEASTIRQLEALEQRKLDIGIVRSPILSTRIKQHKLFDEGFVLVLPTSFTSADNFKNLIDMPFISYNSSYAPNYHQNILEICCSLGFMPKIVHECNTIHSIIELVQHELGAAIIPKSVQIQYQHLALKFVDLSYTGIRTSICMAYDPENKNIMLPLFVDILKEQLML